MHQVHGEGKGELNGREVVPVAFFKIKKTSRRSRVFCMRSICPMVPLMKEIKTLKEL